ncbi:MAG: hypothetical protein WC565_08695 [Parcubacteria group bacterium]
MIPLWIEIIGSPENAWVAEVEVLSGCVRSRRIDHAMYDYSGTNSVGSRGIRQGYLLKEQTIYEVSSPESWKRTDRYYCVVEDGELKRLDAKDVLEWASRV